jgi:hypothetical protein
MGPHLIVMPPPLLDADRGIDAVAEQLPRQELVAELAVERFVGAILPRSPDRSVRSRSARPVTTAGSRTRQTPAHCLSRISESRRAHSRAASTLRSRGPTECRRRRRWPSHSRVHSSMIVRHFSAWPLGTGIEHEVVHTWFRLVERRGRGRLAAARRRWRRRGTWIAALTSPTFE